MTKAIELYRLTNGLGCRLWAIPGTAWGALTGILSDNLWQFSDDARAEIERLLAMACEIEGLIQDVAIIRALLQGGLPVNWNDINPSIWPPPYEPLERGVGTPPGGYSGGSWAEYDEGLCSSAQQLFYEQREILEQVLDLAVAAGGITVAALGVVMAALCPPLALAMEVASGVTAYLLEDAADALLDTMDGARHDIVCAIYGAANPSQAKTMVDDVVLATFGANAAWVRHLWWSTLLNDLMLGSIIIDGGTPGYCTNCEVPPTPGDTLLWEFATSPADWAYSEGHEGCDGYWDATGELMYQSVPSGIVYQWCQWEVSTQPLGYFVSADTELSFDARLVWSGQGLGGDGYCRLFLQQGTEEITRTVGIGRSGEWYLSVTDISQYVGYRLNAIRFYLRQASSTLEFDNVRVGPAPPDPNYQEWDFALGDGGWSEHELPGEATAVYDDVEGMWVLDKSTGSESAQAAIYVYHQGNPGPGDMADFVVVPLAPTGVAVFTFTGTVDDYVIVNVWQGLLPAGVQTITIPTTAPFDGIATIAEGVMFEVYALRVEYYSGA